MKKVSTIMALWTIQFYLNLGERRWGKEGGRYIYIYIYIYMLLPRLLAVTNFQKLSKKLCVGSHPWDYYSYYTLVLAYLYG